MRNPVRESLALLLAAALAAACGGGGGGVSCTNPAALAGEWSGAVTNDNVARGASGGVDASFTTSGCSVTGSWSFSFPSDPALDQTLTVTGSSQGTTVSLDLRNSGTSCDFHVTATLVSATEISGSYQTTDNCSSSEMGSFDITFRAALTPTPTAVPTPKP